MRDRLLLLIALVLILLPSMAKAEFKFEMENDFYGQGRSYWPSSANPDNAVAQIPDGEGTADLRPEFKYLDSRNRVIVRPRWVLDERTWVQGQPQVRNTYSSGNFFLTDAYAERQFTRKLRATAGLEVYEWGPAELMNVSNPLFHLRTNGRSAFFKEKGEDLVRISYDANKRWNIMAIANPISNNDPQWEAETTFQASGFLKIERRSNSGQNYFGVLAGDDPRGLPMMGEYGDVSLDSGWSFYVDARQTWGDRSFAPVTDDQGFIEIEQNKNDQALYGQTLFGIRWEGRVDVRAEVYYNSSGLTPDQFHLAMQGLRDPSPYTVSNFDHFSRSGLELPGQAYFYFSLRIPDLGKGKDASAYFRTFSSLQDGSELVQLAYDHPWGDSVVVVVELNATFGNQDSELTLLERYDGLLGIKWTL